MLASRDYLMAADKQDLLDSKASNLAREQFLKWAQISALVEIAEALSRMTGHPAVDTPAYTKEDLNKK